MRGRRCKTCPSPLRSLIDGWLTAGHSINCIAWHLLRIDHHLPSTSLAIHCEVHLGRPVPPSVYSGLGWHYTPYAPIRVLPPMRPELVLVRGLPGVGKTQVARSYAATHAHMEADLFFARSDGWIERMETHQFPAAHEWCQVWTRNLLRRGYNVVVANTFVTQQHMAWYVREAAAQSSRVRVIEVREGEHIVRPGKIAVAVPYLRRQWEPCSLPVEVIDRPMPDAQAAAAVHYQCQAGVCSLYAQEQGMSTHRTFTL